MRVHSCLVVASVLLLSLSDLGCSAPADGGSGPGAAAGPGASTTPPTPPTPSGDPTAAPKPPSGTPLPLVTPPVRAAVPASLAGGKSLMRDAPRSLTLDPSDMKSRFFTEGPTSIFRLLALVDSGITEINGRIAGGDAPCLASPPVAYSLSPFGSSIPFFAQCQATNANGFVQFGQMNGSTYLYSVAGAGPVAVQVTPIGDGGYEVHAWMSIADGKTTGGSYGVIELLADSSAHSFELAVAGRGFGYCGAQLKSDGTSVYEIGSSDMGTTCNEPATACVSASDVLAPGTCGLVVEKFVLGALGRVASAGATGPLAASGYPGEPLNGILLDGSATDSTTFGPTAPTAGVAALGR
jgi:hypothetical protein